MDGAGKPEHFVPMLPFTSNLRRRAEALGLSNAEVARRAGLSERRYANYVAGTREPDLATLLRIAKVLGVTPDPLLGANEVEPDAGSLLHDRLILAARTLNESDLEGLVVQAEALAKLRSTDRPVPKTSVSGRDA